MIKITGVLLVVLCRNEEAKKFGEKVIHFTKKKAKKNYARSPRIRRAN